MRGINESMHVGVHARSDSSSSSSSSSERPAEVTLYQCAVCPFCNKVRTTLDYYNVVCVKCNNASRHKQSFPHQHFPLLFFTSTCGTNLVYIHAFFT